MRILLRNKRALSPLAATILLISFAIALGIVILNFGQSIIHETTAQPQTINGQTICPIGCVAEDLFTNPSSPLITEIKNEARGG